MNHHRKRSKPSTPTANDGPLALQLFDRVFRGPSWLTWRVWLQAVFGLPMTEAEAEVYLQCTARANPPSGPAREAWVIAGRRSGKSRMAAFLATFLAAVRQYHLAPGERGIVMVIAPGRRQATVILDYTEAFLGMLPGDEVVRRTTDEIQLATGITIAVQTASFRTPRGFTCVAAIIDEIAFLRSDDAAEPDTEIVRALRPSLASVRGSLLLAISSPYAQRGLLFEVHERQFGKDSEVLVWQAETRLMNPTIAQDVVDQAMEDDPSAAHAEWLAQFRTDLESLFARPALDAVVSRDRFELAPMTSAGYVAFVDPSGGSHDAFTLGIAHRDSNGRPILDLVREVKPPFSPEAVCKQFAAELKRYRVKVVFSDAYASEWPREQFAKNGITVEPSPLSRSELFLELLPMVNSGECELLDHPRLLTQLANLERRTGRSGKDSVDHRPGGFDDLANAAGGALVMAARSTGVLAQLPADFTLCVNSEATAATQCPFLYQGVWFPSDPHCRKYCAGLKAVLPVYRQHREEAARLGEPVLTPWQFLRQRFEENPFTERFAIRYVFDDLHNRGW